MVAGLASVAPLTAVAFTTSGLSLLAAPFVCGFYSKHAILEALLAAPVNACPIVLFVVGAGLTAAYVFRLTIGVV